MTASHRQTPPTRRPLPPLPGTDRAHGPGAAGRGGGKVHGTQRRGGAGKQFAFRKH